MTSTTPSTSSLSKGCFVIREQKKAGRKRGRNESLCDQFAKVPGEPYEHYRARFEIYQDTWRKIEDQVTALLSGLNNKIFVNLLEFVKQNFSIDKTFSVRKEIPTGVFITGVNMPDHDVTFSQLLNELHKVTPYVSRVCSKSCPNIRSIMKEVIDQIVETVDFIGEDIEPEKSKHTHRRGQMNFADFKCWYELQEAAHLTDEDKTRRPVVFIFEDFESFQVKALQDFITICSLYVDKLPIILLFGIATVPAVVHQLLPRSISSFLRIEKFHAQPAISYLLEVISHSLISSKFSFKLGPMVFQYLYENFLFHDFSLQNFMSGLKFCMMDHFYSNPLSVLCSKFYDKSIKQFSHNQIEILRKCSSFRTYAEKQDQQELRSLLLNDSHTVQVALKKLKDLDCYHCLFFPVLRCLTALVSKLPSFPLGRKCRDVYEHCLKTSVRNMTSYQEAMKMAAFLAKDELVPVLKECIEFLVTAIQNNRAVCHELNEFVDTFKLALVSFEQLSQVSKGTPAGNSTAVRVNVVSSVTSRFELQENLRNAVYSKKKDSPFEKTRENVISSLDKMFQRYLLAPTELPLHEVFYYERVEVVKQRLSGCPRVAMQTALNNPRYYLNCNCCDIEPGGIQDTLPDISVAFKLHLECGRLINLFDWLQAFLTVTESPDSKSRKKTKSSEQLELQARFIQAVSEMQFLGFVKATKRKTDHVARLTWGSC